MPSHRALSPYIARITTAATCLATTLLAVLTLVAARPAHAWNSNVLEADEDSWLAPWDDEHRQIAFAALASINAQRYGDISHAPPLAPGAVYRTYRTGQPFGKCLIGAGKRRPGLTGTTAGGGFCLLDMGRWWAGIEPLNPPLQVFLTRRADASTGDDVNTPLEERYLPDMDHFNELPDSAYSLGDWLLKSSYCPAQPGVPDQFGFFGCHGTGFLGAATNSSHFGEEARLHWRRFHHIAVRLAARAAALRAKLDVTRPELAQVVEEAEREALTYEGIAGHFLADRWAAGHMFNRLGSPDGLAFQDVDLGLGFPTPGLIPNALAGAITGLLHGAQEKSVFTLPNSSPGVVIRYDNAGDPPIVIRRLLTAIEAYGFRSGSGPDPFEPCGHGVPCAAMVDGIALSKLRLAGATHDAIGDFRWLDLQAGTFTPNEFEHRTPTDKPFPGGNTRFALGETAFQRAALIDCMARSQAEVIRAFGPLASGGFGLKGVMIPETTGGRIDDEAKCFDLWLTNRSIGRAVSSAGIQKLPELARAHLVFNRDSTFQNLLAGSFGNYARIPITALFADIIGQATTDPDGTSLAHDLPPLFGISPHPQSLAAYAEPEDLTSLPEVDALQLGRSKRFIFGAFNRAHADYWCKQVDAGMGDRGPIANATPFAAPLDDNKIPLQSLRRPAYHAPANASERDARDRDEAVCELMASRVFHHTTTRSLTCSEFGCDAIYTTFEELDPLCDAVGAGPVGAAADELTAGYAPAYDSDDDTLPVHGDDIALDPDRGFSQSIVAWCESKPAIMNAALPLARDQRGHRYVLPNELPTLTDVTNSPEHDFAPTFYLSGFQKYIPLQGFNFGRKVSVMVQNVDTAEAKFFSYDADLAPESEDPNVDLANGGAWFHPAHASGSAVDLDEIRLRLHQFAPGEYDIRITNTTDPARPRVSVATTRVRIACDPADDFPNRPDGSITRQGNACVCVDPAATLDHGLGSNPDGDSYVCYVDPCAGVFAACGKAPLHGDPDPETARQRSQCYADYFGFSSCGGSCCLCLLYDIPGAC